jgi:hypothetical protein
VYHPQSNAVLCYYLAQGRQPTLRRVRVTAHAMDHMDAGEEAPYRLSYQDHKMNRRADCLSRPERTTTRDGRFVSEDATD